MVETTTTTTTSRKFCHRCLSTSNSKKQDPFSSPLCRFTLQSSSMVLVVVFSCKWPVNLERVCLPETMLMSFFESYLFLHRRHIQEIVLYYATVKKEKKLKNRSRNDHRCYFSNGMNHGLLLLLLLLLPMTVLLLY